MAIAHRFVESVSYEPDEEERLRQIEQARELEEEGISDGASDEPLLLTDGGEEDDLPPSLDLFMRRHKLQLVPAATASADPINVDVVSTADTETPDVATSDVVDGGALVDPVDASTDPVDTGDELVTDVNVITPPVDAEPDLGPAIELTAVGVRLQPPRGWEQQEEVGVVHFFTPIPGEEIAASFSVSRLDRGPLDAEQYIDLARASQQAEFESFELTDEQSVEFGNEPAYQFSAIATQGGLRADVRQTLVVKGGVSVDGFRRLLPPWLTMLKSLARSRPLKTPSKRLWLRLRCSKRTELPL